MDISEIEKQENEFWETSPLEKPGDTLTKENLENKQNEATALLEKLDIYAGHFENAESVLEIGGGQLWASCIVKARFPQINIAASDIAPAAIESSRHWEEFYGVKLDKTFACKSHEIPVGDGSIDLVFAFASAHHFRRHRKTLKEINRILKPGGVALYLYEPACPRAWYERNFERINASRPEVPEDYLVFPHIEKIADEEGFDCEVTTALAERDKSAVKNVYYAVMNLHPSFKYYFPRCNVDMCFTKRGALSFC